AIWSRIGETARQGPHHSAQKPTRMVSSDFRTSSSKVASVTLSVDIVLSLFPYLIPLRGYGDDRLGELGQIVFGVESRDGAGPGGRDRLLVGRVDDVAGGEDAGDRRP